MSTSIREEIYDDVAVLVVIGNLVAGPDVVVLHDHVKKLVGNGVIRVVVDFSAVSWFGSAMLGVLAASYSTIVTAGGGVRLIGVTAKVAQIMDVTRLSDVFETLPTLDVAMASLRGCDPVEA
ncbi:MAG: STAS domain-containing protein [Candidatus Latescibacteria bacterium]|jgi:anti-sigma B factor antagonist|nr:STAS domain-containing protein [Candidatus Latescibacterota bacterium]MBT5829547.1 STAS domain-containing protein [Candidatus Latescibacterota bacterium]